MTDFEKYLTKIKGNFRQAVKIEWLNTDESTNFEFTNLLYDINASVSVNYQNGSRRSCTIIINNNRNQCPVDPNNIWFGQKFKLWMGVYLDNETPYYFPQGVFYVSNPTDTYRPETRTVQINGVDKWAFLDGSLFGKLQVRITGCRISYEKLIGRRPQDKWFSRTTRIVVRIPFL